MTALPGNQEDLVALINQIIDTRTSPSPQAEKCRGLVDQVQGTPVFTFSAFIDGASTSTPGIPYPAGNPPVTGATVTLERRREDGFIQLTGVDAAFAVDGGVPIDLSGLITEQELADHAALPIHLINYNTPSTLSTDAGHWSLIGSGTLDSQYDQVVATVLIDGNSGAVTDFTRGTIRFRIKQQAAFGSDPIVLAEMVDGSTGISGADVVVVVTDNTGPTLYSIYVRLTRTGEWLSFIPLWTETIGCVHTWAGCSAFVTSLPSGTQTSASPLRQGARVSAGAIAAGTKATVTVTWPTPFADTAYTVVCSLIENDAAIWAVTANLQSKAAGSCVVRIANQDVAAHTPAIHAIAIHD